MQETTPDLSFSFSSREGHFHTVHQHHFPLQGILMGRGWELLAAWPFQILLLPPLVAICPQLYWGLPLLPEQQQRCPLSAGWNRDGTVS